MNFFQKSIIFGLALGLALVHALALVILRVIPAVPLGSRWRKGGIPRRRRHLLPLRAYVKNGHFWPLSTIFNECKP